jgi:sulfide:quinone oxidoreductase
VSEPRLAGVLGGGVGGVVAARELRRRLPRPHRVVVVDREPLHLFAPSLLWLMVGHRDAGSIRRPLKGLERKGIDVRIGEVERIDPAARRVTLAGGEVLRRPSCVLGAELDPARPGIARRSQLLHLARRGGVPGRAAHPARRPHRRDDRRARLQVPGGSL